MGKGRCLKTDSGVLRLLSQSEGLPLTIADWSN